MFLPIKNRKVLLCLSELFIQGSATSITDFFEQEFQIWHWTIPKRVLISILIVLLAKVAGAAFIYFSMNMQFSGTFWTDPARVYGLPQNNVLLRFAGVGGNVPYLFFGWDSAWYLSIVTEGYQFSPQTYAFMPIFPTLTFLLNVVVQQPPVAMAALSSLFGILWMPFYQLLAETYIGKRAALASALVLAFSPFLFVFTTVTYAESPFLLFTLSSLYLFRKGRVGWASLLAGFAVLSRVMGILILLPMLYSSLKHKGGQRLRKVVLSILPVTAVVIWLGFCFLSSGDAFASMHTTEWSNLYTIPAFIRDTPQFGLKIFWEIQVPNWPATPFSLLPIAVALAFGIPPFLIYHVSRFDRGLALYSFFGYIGFLLVGAIASAPRFASVLFPLWLPLTAGLTLRSKSQLILVAAVLASSYIVALWMWISFLSGQFVA